MAVQVKIQADLDTKLADASLKKFVDAAKTRTDIMPSLHIDTKAAEAEFNNFINTISARAITIPVNFVQNRSGGNRGGTGGNRGGSSNISSNASQRTYQQHQLERIVHQALQQTNDPALQQTLRTLRGVSAKQFSALGGRSYVNRDAMTRWQSHGYKIKDVAAQAKYEEKLLHQATRDQERAIRDQEQLQREHNRVALTRAKAAKANATFTKKQAKYSKISANSNMGQEMQALRNTAQGIAKGDTTYDLKKVNAQWAQLEENAKASGMATKSWGDSFRDAIGVATRFFGAYEVVSWMKRFGTEVKQNVVDINTAMTDLRKVTDATEGQYKRYQESAAGRAVAMNIGVDEYISGTTGFARAGYSMRDAQSLGELATIYYNVGDGVASVDDATASMISTMKAFNLTAADGNRIIDVFNKLSNEYAINSGDIGTIMEGAASALSVAGASMEETAAMGTAMYEVNRNAGKTASTLKVVSLRLRGSKTELAEMGEETDNVVESTSKMRDEIKAITGFDILDGQGNYKGFYEIMKGIATEWAKMDQNSTNAAALLELIAGKNRASDTAALLNNFATAEEALLDATNSSGSAMKEYSKWQDSIEAKQKKVNAQVQNLSLNLLNDKTLGSAYDAYSSLLDIVISITESMGAWGTLAAAAMPAIAKMFPQLNAVSTAQDFFGETQLTSWFTSKKQRQQWISAAEKNDLSIFQQAANHTDQKRYWEDNITRLSSVGQNVFKTLDESVLANNAQAVDALSKRFIELRGQASTTSGTLKGLWSSIKAGTKAFAGFAASTLVLEAVVFAITKIGQAIYDAAHATEYAIEAADAMKESWDESSESSKNAAKLVAESAERFDELSQGVSATGQNQTLTAEEYQEYLDISNEIARIFPEVVMGYDAAGNAIIDIGKAAADSTTQVQMLNDALAAQDRRERQRKLEQLGEASEKGYTGWQGEMARLYSTDEGSYIDKTTYQNILESLTKYFGSNLPSQWDELLEELYPWRMTMNNKELNTRLGSLFGRIGTSDILLDSKASDDERYQAYLDSGIIAEYQDIMDEVQALLRDASLQLTQDLGTAREAAGMIFDNARDPLALGKWGGDAFGKSDDAWNDVLTSALRTLVTSLGADFFIPFTSDELMVEGVIGLLKEMGENEDFISKFSNMNSVWDSYLKGGEGANTIGDVVDAAKDLDEFMSGLPEGSVLRSLVAPIEAMFGDNGIDSFVARLAKEVGASESDAFSVVRNWSVSQKKNVEDQIRTGTLGATLDGKTGLEALSYLDKVSRQAAATAENISAINDAYQAFANNQKAVAELISKETLAAEDVDTARSAGYGDAIGYNALTGGYQLNYSAYRDINEIKAQEAIADILQERIRLQKALDEEIARGNKLAVQGSTDAANASLARANELDQQIQQCQLLSEQYRLVTSALQGWRDASNMPEAGDNFREIKSAVEELRNGLEQGRINTNKFNAALELMFGKNARGWSEEELTRNLESSLEKFERYYTEAGQLNRDALMQDWVAAGAMKASVGADGQTDYTFIVDSIAKIAELVEMPEELVGNMVSALGEYTRDDVNKYFTDAAQYLSQDAEAQQVSALNTNTAALEHLAGVISESSKDAEAEGSSKPSGNEASIGADTSPAWDGLSELQKKIGERQTVPVIADTSAAVSVTDALIRKISKPVTLPVKVSFSGAHENSGRVPSGGGYAGGGADHPAVTVDMFASGTANAPGGPALISEAGPEILVDSKTGTWRLVKTPQLVDLNQGDIVYSAADTKRLLAGCGGAVSGRSFADGKLARKAGAWARGNTRITLTKKNSPVISGSGSSSNPNRNGSSGGGGGSGNGSGDAQKDAKEFFDWIQRALEVATKATQKLVKEASALIGYVAKNAALNKAIKANQKELKQNQAAEKRYNQHVDKLAQESGFDSAMLEKIRNGDIDLTQYDADTIKKIEEIQKYMKLAEECAETVEELKEQERELNLTKLDNIISHYDQLIERQEASLALSEAERDYKVATGSEVTEDDYKADLDANNKKLEELKKAREAYKKQFDELVKSGQLVEGSDDWYEYLAKLSEFDQQVIETQTAIAQLKNEMANLPLRNLNNALERLKAAEAELSNLQRLHDAQGMQNTADSYEDLIDNGFEQIENLTSQNNLLRQQQKGLDVNSDRWQELQKQIEENEQAIWDIKIAQEEWNDAIADLEIERLQKERDELEKTNEALRKKKEMEQAIEDLERARSQRNKLVYREGVGFVYEADQNAIREAQERIDELQHQELLDKIDEIIEAIKDNKENDNVHDENGNPNQNRQAVGMGDVEAGALLGQVRDTLDLEHLLADSRGSQGGQGAAGAQGTVGYSIQIGDIIVQGVQDVDDLADRIVSELPNSITQRLYGR